MENYADQGACYPPRRKVEVDNILRDLLNSSGHTKAEFKFFLLLFTFPFVILH